MKETLSLIDRQRLESMEYFDYGHVVMKALRIIDDLEDSLNAATAERDAMEDSLAEASRVAARTDKYTSDRQAIMESWVDDLEKALNESEESLRTTQLRLKDYHDANIKMQARVEELTIAVIKARNVLKVPASSAGYDSDPYWNGQEALEILSKIIVPATRVEGT